jgi:hypothetical protein
MLLHADHHAILRADRNVRAAAQFVFADAGAASRIWNAGLLTIPSTIDAKR